MIRYVSRYVSCIGSMYRRYVSYRIIDTIHKTSMFLYSAVSSPLARSKHFTLFLPWQTCSLRHQLGFSWKHSSHAAITRNYYSLTFPPLSIARYSFIQLSEHGRQWRKQKCPIFETIVKRIRTRAPLIESLAFYR